jgi:hypothetical protein
MVVGVGWLKPAETICDPVTTISCRSPVVLPWLSGCGKSAAPARMGAAARTNNDAQQTYKSRLTVSIILDPWLQPLSGGFLWRVEHKHAFTQPSTKKTSFMFMLLHSVSRRSPEGWRNPSFIQCDMPPEDPVEQVFTSM